MKCKRCSNENANDRTNCWFCGEQLPHSPEPSKLEVVAHSQPFSINWRSLGIYLGILGLLFMGIYLVGNKQRHDLELADEKKKYEARETKLKKAELELENEKQQYEAREAELKKQTENAESIAKLVAQKVAELDTKQSAQNIEASKPLPPSSTAYSDNSQLRDFIERHFKMDNTCNVDNLMDFYNDEGVYYDGKLYDKSGIRYIKQSSCEHLSQGHDNTIRSGSVSINKADFNQNIVGYIVDWKYFSPKQQKSITGATEVNIIVQTKNNSPKIIRETHKKLYSDL